MSDELEKRPDIPPEVIYDQLREHQKSGDKKPYTTPTVTGPFTLAERDRRLIFEVENRCKRALLLAIKERGTENAAGFYDEYLAVVRGTQEPKPPEVTMQMLIDAGFNAFGLQLFVESVADRTYATSFKPFSFVFRNIKITMEPHGAVDTRHH